MLLYGWLQSAVKSKGGSKALIYRDTYLSWRGLLHRVDRRADEFAAMEVRPGDIVGLMLGNVPDFVILSLALSKLGAAPLPLDPTASTRELEMLMSVLPLRGLITRPRGGDAPLPALRGVGAASMGATGAGLPGAKPSRRKQTPESRKRLQGTLLSCSTYAAEARAVPRKKEAQLAAVLVTADSAGDPKPVDRTQANLAAEAAQVGRAIELTSEDRVLLTVPLFHSFGFDVGMVAALAAGSTLYLEDEIAASRVIKLVREQKITVLPGSQTLFTQLGRLPSTRPLTHKGVRMLSLGGGLSGAALDAFAKKYGVRPLGCCHTTETGTISIDTRGQAGDTVGKPLAKVLVRIADLKTNRPVKAGQTGSLRIRGAAVSALTLGKPPPGNTSLSIGSSDREGWYHTGDLAALDRAGRLVLQGREDDLVRIEGKRVALGEVEGCIEAFPKVSAAQAEVITDPLGGPMVVARVVLKGRGKIDPEAIIDHCARNLAPYKVPRRIEICDAL
jgi:long-chain acyl-CoA synthetase